MTETLVLNNIKVPRQDLVDALRQRDGVVCQFPDCGGVLDFSITEGKDEVTLDHWIPQHFGKANGWTREEIWAVSNLKLMHKKCNAKKGDRVPDENGILPERVTKRFRYRRDKRAGRPELCFACDNGNNLFIGEFCASCGCDAKRFPQAAKVSYPECDHEITWCWVCSITPEMRPAAVDMAVLSGESGEWDD